MMSEQEEGKFTNHPSQISQSTATTRESIPGELPGEQAQPRGADDKNMSLGKFFGELEIKGLINVSFYAFYCQIELDGHLG